MRSLILTLTILLTCFAAKAQGLTGKVENHPKKEMDVVLMLFGMDYPITIGKVDPKGQISVNLEGVGIAGIPEKVRSMFMGELIHNFYFSCGDFSAFGELGRKPALRQDFLRLTQGDQWSGTVFLVSDEKLRPWLEDSGYSNAVKGSFYEIMYVAEDLAVRTTCTNQIFASEEEMVDVVYDFELKLKKGFNWVEYEILEIHETNPENRASFPSKVKVRDLQDPSAVKWIGLYY
ncbi:MAG: hypothetical protein B7Z16_15630 [Algoriphagus sp. 32-45-6]|nr:MAG: hypothetical protein B7Z16_15630 [Algoriphagus sp. 32-45-6]